jgi:hypothetical protein
MSVVLRSSGEAARSSASYKSFTQQSQCQERQHSDSFRGSGIDEAGDLRDLVGRNAAQLRVASNERLVRGVIDVIDLVSSDVAVQAMPATGGPD